MTAERWQRLKLLYDAAAGVKREDWDTFIKAHCGGDEDLAQSLRKLLQGGASHSILDYPVTSLSPQAAQATAPGRHETFEPGQVVNGRFEIAGFLGKGGMGEVYQAFDRELQERVALKTIRGDTDDAPAMLQRLRHEVRQSRRIAHGNVCRVYDLFTYAPEGDAPVSFLTMQLLTGPTLAAVLRSKGRMATGEAIRLARQMLSALAAAHEAGIIHRDFKPGNVVLVGFGKENCRAVVTDFGLAIDRAQPAGNATDAHGQGAMGTPEYMAPERFRGLATAASDTYSFGVVLFEMLTGATPQGTVHLPGSVPERIRNIIRRCLKTSPEDRFGSAAEILAAMDTHGGGHAARAKRWVAIGALAACAAAIYWMARPPAPPRITATVQITSDGLPKVWPLLTDGSRLLFNSSLGAQQVSVRGGESAPLPLAVKDALVEQISPDATELLLCRYTVSTAGCELWVAPLMGGSGRRLGDLMVRHPAVAWSPDGQRLVFAKGHDLFIAGRDGSGVRRVAGLTGEAAWVRWSPDGNRVRFSVESHQAATLWDLRLDGSGAYPVLPGWNPTWHVCCGNWTADGKYFVFAAGRLGTFDSNIWALREKAGLRARGGRGPFQLTTGPLATNWPVASADGKRLFVEGRQERNEFRRYDVVANALLPELRGISGKHLEYSRDGQWITYVAVPDGSLWRGAADGSQRLQLTTLPMQANMPHWSPDGTRIAFHGARAGERERIYVVGRDGGTPEQVTHGESGAGGDRDAAWSPDGTSLAFGCAHKILKCGANIRVLDLKSRRVGVLAGSDGMWAPRWSPDGRWIAGLSETDSRLMLYDVRARRAAQLNSVVSGYPGWSRNSDWLFYMTVGGMRRGGEFEYATGGRSGLRR